MKLITRDTDYALRALRVIARAKGKRTTVSQLVETLRIPRPFLRKLLQILGKHNILVSTKGIQGGFWLARPARAISVMDVIECFQGPFSINECVFKKSVCPNTGACLLRKKLSLIQDRVSRELARMSIASLVQ